MLALAPLCGCRLACSASNNLDQVLDGDLDAVIDACVAADQTSRLSEGGTH